MEPDKYQQAWQAQSSQTRVKVDAELLLKTVQRNQQATRAVIYFGDLVTIAVTLLLVPVWIYMGVANPSPWTWYLMVPDLVWVAGFTVVVRARRKRRPDDPDKPLLRSVKESLALVEDQIWFYRNSLWWYVLPIGLPLVAYPAHLLWLKSIDPYVGASMVVFNGALFYVIYYINQRVVRTQYEPRRQELLTLLASLGNETASEVSGEYPILMSTKGVEWSPRRMFVASLCIVAVLLIVIAGIVLMFRHSLASIHHHSERSPFAAVRWEESEPEVRVGEEWFELVSLDEIPASEILAFSRRTYGKKWRMRFEEDLVELLTRMGHPPRDTVRLVVQSQMSAEARTLEGVPMTEANRRAIKAAAGTRETSEP